MRWVLRAVCLAALAVAALAIFNSRWLQQTRETIAGGAGGVPATPRGDDEALDDVRPPLENPLTQSLDDFIGSQADAFGDAGDGLRDELAEADALLSEAKQRNRSAMRQANRQVRIPGRSPNVVLIVVRNLLQQDLACYGSSAHVTPQFDVLAAEGVRAEAFYGTARPEGDLDTLLTGHSDGNARRGTLPEVLWQAGYTTGLIGDGSPPSIAAAAPAFDAWFGFRDESDARQPFPEVVWSNGRHLRLPGNTDGGRATPATELFVDEALSYLTRHRRGRPFALLVSLRLPRVVDAASDRPGVSAVEKLDLQVGRIISGLDDLNIARNTLLVVAGGRGGRTTATAKADVEPLLRHGPHGLYEGDLRLPLLVRWPSGRVGGGRVVRSPGRLDDLLPTLAAAVLAARRPRVDGVSLLPAWRGSERAARHPDLYWRSSQQPGALAARSGDWKAIRLSDGTVELYHLERDAAEANDLAAEQPQLLARFKKFFARVAP